MNVSPQAVFEHRSRELSFAQAQTVAIFENSPLGVGAAALDGPNNWLLLLDHPPFGDA